jgi:hypothetical protein
VTRIKSRNTEQVPCAAKIIGAAPKGYSVRANRSVSEGRGSPPGDWASDERWSDERSWAELKKRELVLTATGQQTHLTLSAYILKPCFAAGLFLFRACAFFPCHLDGEPRTL